MSMNHYIAAARRRLRFFLNAKTRYDLHSPFVAELAAQVLEDRRSFYAFSDIEIARHRWRFDREAIPASNLGAGSLVNAGGPRSAGDILHSSAVDAETGRRLFRLAHWQKPATLLELGTSQGISTAYLASADRQARVFSIEGNPPLAEKAKTHFAELGLENIEVTAGSFEERLPAVLKKMERVDLLFIDGDHRETALLQYARQCAAYRTDDSVFVIADIHWSDEMERGWAQLCALPEVTLSVDLFHFGLLFFKKEFRERQHLAIVPARWKPWRLGFFGKFI
jgi:hypothetical protein